MTTTNSIKAQSGRQTPQAERRAPQAERRTQAERRAETRQAVLDSAVRLFGEKGFAHTSLEEIAADCGLTIRPIYHYFGNKKALFEAVNAVMEQRIVDSMRLGEGIAIEDNWRAYLDLCDDPAFRRIVLIDSPNVLGRERWADSAVSEKARSALNPSRPADLSRQYRQTLLSSVFMAAFTEAALVVAEAEDIALARREAEQVMGRLFSLLRED